MIMHCNKLIVTPINLGFNELVSINDLANMVAAIGGVKLVTRYNPDAPQGVAGGTATTPSSGAF
jgi:hypothetical protein